MLQRLGIAFKALVSSISPKPTAMPIEEIQKLYQTAIVDITHNGKNLSELSYKSIAKVSPSTIKLLELAEPSTSLNEIIHAFKLMGERLRAMGEESSPQIMLKKLLEMEYGYLLATINQNRLNQLLQNDNKAIYESWPNALNERVKEARSAKPLQQLEMSGTKFNVISQVPIDLDRVLSCRNIVFRDLRKGVAHPEMQVAIEKSGKDKALSFFEASEKMTHNKGIQEDEDELSYLHQSLFSQVFTKQVMDHILEASAEEGEMIIAGQEFPQLRITRTAENGLVVELDIQFHLKNPLLPEQKPIIRAKEPTTLQFVFEKQPSGAWSCAEVSNVTRS